ncbi:MAG: CapA family protein [Eubacterium sp.]|nr:CapA family protein [Eubacterium sp.]
MSDILQSPENLTAAGADGCATMRWTAVSGAEGYLLKFYQNGKLIKRRYSQKNSKTILGFTNGKEYSVSVTAFCYDKNGNETFGKESGQVPFVPICERLKAQSVICLSSGESAQIKWEYKNTVPQVTFVSLDPDIAEVSDGGLVTAHKKGRAVIELSFEQGSTQVEVYVDRAARPQGEATLLFGGDIMCALAHQRTAKGFSYDFSGCFDGIKDILKNADFSVAVLETVCDDGAPYEHEQKRLDGGSPNCNSPSDFLDAVRDAGFSALVTANNHNFDTGEDGLIETVVNIKRRGMFNIGTAGDNPVLINIKGITVAFVAANLISNGLEKGLSDEDKADLIGFYDKDDVVRKITYAREQGADFVAVYLHWGTMNSVQVRSQQITASKDIAEAGANLIIGSHPHVMQKYGIIKTTDGRSVPCVYSLGNLFTSMNELSENRDSALLKLRLSKRDGRMSGKISFVPTLCTDCEKGVRIDPITYPVNREFEESLARTQKALGPAAVMNDKPLILLQGSAVLRNIFADSDFNTDGAGLIISQLAVTGEKAYAAQGESQRVRLEVEKSFDKYIESSGAEYIAVDFYTAASLSCYRLGDELYTASQGFKSSGFFKQHENEFELVRPPFDKQPVRERIKRYAELLTARFSPDKIILVRLRFSDMAVTHGQLRNTASRDSLNRRMRELEELFISFADPIVIDVAGQYFSDCTADNQPSSFEPYFYRHAQRLFGRILSGENRRYYSEPDCRLWLQRIINCYDNMTARSYQDKLLGGSAADTVIKYTSKDFIARYSSEIIKLKQLPDADLAYAAEIFDGEFAAAIRAINALVNNDIDKPYDFYAPIFRERLNAVKLVAELLTKQTGYKVDTDTAEEAFLLKDSPDRLKEFYDSLDRVKVDIWGSCVTRETVNRNKRKIEVGRYIFKQPHVLAYEQPIDYTLPQEVSKYCGSKWRMRTIQEAFAHSGAALIGESRSPWLLVDLYDLICTMCEYKGGLFETDDFIRRCGFFNDIAGELTDTYLFKSRSAEYCDSGMKKFAELVSGIYGKNIILIRADLKDSYIGLDRRLKKMPEDKDLKTKRAFIARYELMFAKLTGCAVIDISRHYYADDGFPLGGAHIAHYEDEFYSDACEKITEIISGGRKRYYGEENKTHTVKRDLRLNRD